MDHHAGFSSSNPMLIEHERDLLRQADLVVTSSTVLENQARRYARKVITIRNGCDYKHFAAVGGQPRGRRPVIGYYGAIAEWFDSDLVADLAERRPDWDFLLVGSTFCGDLHRLLRCRNVSLPGEKPYSCMPEWLAKFNVAILPFKRNALTEAANPVKAYEIFASGKPLVSVPLPEMVPMTPLTRLASTVGEFEREILMELNGPDPALQRQRRAFAQNNTWEKRFEKMSAAMEEMVSTVNSQATRRTAGDGSDLRRIMARGLQNPARWNQQGAPFISSEY
jgi:glycosyltransferase involved in cell wall biosynthesis